jgi:hypothetical protein
MQLLPLHQVSCFLIHLNALFLAIKKPFINSKLCPWLNFIQTFVIVTSDDIFDKAAMHHATDFIKLLVSNQTTALNNCDTQSFKLFFNSSI